MMKQIRNRILIIFCFILVASIPIGCLSNNNSNRVSQVIPYEYIQIIDTYQKIVEDLLSGQLEENWNTEEKIEFSCSNTELLGKWNNMQIELMSRNHYEKLDKSSFGYVLMDINKDGVQELIWILNDYTILAVFTISDGSAILLDAYWSRYKSAILETGQLLTFASNGAQDFEYSVQEINTEGEALFCIIQFGCEEGMNYRVDGKDRISVSEAEFQELTKMYSKVFIDKAMYMKSLGLEILPLLNE